MALSGKFYRVITPLLFLSAEMHAQEGRLQEGFRDSVRRLDEVVVVAGRRKTILPPQRLEGRELDALGSFSVADAIRYFSGVQIKDYGGIGGLKTVDIRSMGTNHMGVFYDGIPLGNAQNGQIDLGKFSLDNIEEIALYNGQKSDVFQSAKDFGAAGTIYLRTRRPTFAKGRTTHLVALVRTGSFGLINPSALWERQWSERVSSSLNVEYVYATGKYRFRYRKVLSDGTPAWDTTAVRRNGDVRALRLEGGLNGYLHKGQWHLKAYFYDSEKGIPGAIVNNVWKRSQRQWDRNFFVQGSFRQQIGRRYDLLVNAKFADDRMRYLNPDTTLMYIDNSFTQREFYLSTAHRYRLFPIWDVSLSADYQWNTLDAGLQDFVYPRRHTVLVAGATALEWRRLKAQASLLATLVFEKVTRPPSSGSPQAGTPDDKREYTPALFLSWRPFPKIPLDVQAFCKRIFRMPTFNDLYYTDVGNVALRPEYTTQYNVGLLYEKPLRHPVFRHIRLKADAYCNEVTDKIIAVPKGNGQYRWMMMNLGYVEIRGLETSAQFVLQLPCGGGMRMRTGVNYTFQRAQDFSDPTDNRPGAGTYGGQIAYIPRHSGSMICSVERAAWDLNYSFIYVGERYHNSSNIRENYEPSWYTHDLTLARSFAFGAVRWRLSAEVNNLFDQQYDVVLNYPMPGRHFKLIIKLEI